MDALRSLWDPAEYRMYMQETMTETDEKPTQTDISRRDAPG